MSNIKAFPSPQFANQNGMDLRDYFAINFANGYVSNQVITRSTDLENAAKLSYEFADEMMKVRNVGK